MCSAVSPFCKGQQNNESHILEQVFNPLPDDKILGLPKLKAFADDKSNVIQSIKVMFHRIENIVGYQHFLLFPQCFQRAFPPVRQKVSLCSNGLNGSAKSRQTVSAD